MSNALSLKKYFRFFKLTLRCICFLLLLIFSPTASKADIDPSSKVGAAIENAASSFKKILADTEKTLGRNLLFADGVLMSNIWLARKELSGLMQKTVGDLSAEKASLLRRMDANLAALRFEIGALGKSRNKDAVGIFTVLNTSLIVGIGPSPVKVTPRIIEPGNRSGKIRIRVSGTQLDGAKLTLQLRKGGPPRAPARELEGAVEFDISRTELPKASGKIQYLSVILTIDESISIRNKIEKLFGKIIERKFNELLKKDAKKRTHPVVLSLLPDHIGTARVFGTRSSKRLSRSTDLKKAEGSVTSVSENKSQLICVTADKGCEIDQRSIRYEITSWNAFYQTEYCDVFCKQPSPYSRPEGKTGGICPLIRTPDGFKRRQTQSCQGNRFEVDKTQWTATKACVALVGRPLMRGVRIRATGKIWGKQKCIGQTKRRALLTKTPLRIAWSGAKLVKVPGSYDGLSVELTTAGGKMRNLTHALNNRQSITLSWSAAARTVKLQPRTRFWWQ